MSIISENGYQNKGYFKLIYTILTVLHEKDTK